MCLIITAGLIGKRFFVNVRRRKFYPIQWRKFAVAAASANQAEGASRSVPYQPVIGLEIHSQIDAKTKLFSNAASNYWASSNTTVNFFDSALPGTLPVLNRRCVEAAVMTALALNCRINLTSLFDRKHYFYSDLPAGYQITQQRRPIAVDGWLEYVVYDEKRIHTPYLKKTAIKQIQLEQDSGKSIHDTGNGRSLIDLNRAGVALLEIVCHHDMDNEMEAACFAKELHAILRIIGVCAGKMERGQFRVDANVSIRQPGDPLGPRTEVKNLNSFRFISRALRFEIERQIKLRSAGMPVINETLTFDYRTGKTSAMRDKELRQDYRFMPEPNLPPLTLVDTAADGEGATIEPNGRIDVNEMRKQFPLLPSAIRATRMEKYGLALEHCFILSENDILSQLFDQVIESNEFTGPKAVKALSLYAEALEDAKVPLGSSNIELDNLIEMILLLDQDRISEHTAFTVLRCMAKGDKRKPIQIIEERNLFVLDDMAEIDRVCDEVFASHATRVKRYQTGNEEKMFHKLFSSVASRLHWRYPERKLKALLREKLSK